MDDFRSKKSQSWARGWGIALAVLADLVAAPLMGASIGWAIQKYWGNGGMALAAIGFTVGFALGSYSAYRRMK